MRIDVLTLFPAVIDGACRHSIVGRARSAGLLDLVCTDIRDFARDRHRSVDDKPFGGGPGMVMMPAPVCEAIDAVAATHPALPIRILLTPQGRRFGQELAETLARHERLMLIAGHYEGFDERIRQAVDLEMSVGDVVVSGGEVPALLVIDALTRLIPGALGAEDGAHEESFRPLGPDGERLLEYPQYTRPRSYRGLDVPEVLIGGDHAKVDRWRMEQARLRTEQRRPDLLD
ncbi:MAG: tRNA (guanine-N(1)-)-methyltransferase [Phycisphaerae bacterium]|nr:tRNA (guanine-N(1)-)-methyltransferase [Phycisphaerae bacterium]